MNAQTAIALLSTVVAAAIAVIVPLISFRLTRRLDHTRWLREQRAQFYVDLLTEAYAEQQWLERDMADGEVRGRVRDHFVDLRLPPVERARLGARGTMFGSGTVDVLFNRMQAEMFWSRPKRQPNDGERTVMRLRLGDIYDELNSLVRKEMGADDLLPDVGSSILRQPHPAQRVMERRWPSLADDAPEEPSTE